MPIPNGNPILVDAAKTNIKKYVDDQVALTATPEAQLVVGHLFDFSLIEDFVNSISDLNTKGANISGIRIYHSKDNREGRIPNLENDLVIIPVLNDGTDYYDVYDRPHTLIAGPLILSDSTPCPNVCDGKNNLNCP